MWRLTISPEKSGDRKVSGISEHLGASHLSALSDLQPDLFLFSNLTSYGPRMATAAAGITLFTELHPRAEKAAAACACGLE